MKLSKKQRVSVCVLALAVAALVADRVFLRSDEAPPAEAGAAPVAGLDELTGTSPSRSPAVEGRSLAARLRELSASADPSSGDVRDAFRLSQAWLAYLSPPKPATAAPESKPKPGRPVHRLTAVILDKDGGRAIVDGKYLRVGQELDGMKLISVSERSAVVESRGTRVELTLESASQADVSR